jgi:hypothetical protein
MCAALRRQRTVAPRDWPHSRPIRIARVVPQFHNEFKELVDGLLTEFLEDLGVSSDKFYQASRLPSNITACAFPILVRQSTRGSRSAATASNS